MRVGQVKQTNRKRLYYRQAYRNSESACIGETTHRRVCSLGYRRQLDMESYAFA